jgi:autotransporter-associated beta strand protein
MKPTLALRRFLLASALLAATHSAHAATYTWIGAVAGAAWTDSGNWSEAAAPGNPGSFADIFNFNAVGASRLTNYIVGTSGDGSTDTGRRLNRLNFNANADSNVVIDTRISSSGNSRTLNFGGTNPTIYVDADAAASHSIVATNSGSVYLQSTLKVEQNRSDTNFTISAAINGDSGAGIIKNGTGGLVLSNSANAYNGGTILNQGTISLSTAGKLGATTGTLQVNNTNTGAGTDVQLTLATSANTTVGSLSGTIATPSGGTNTANITTGSTGGARTFTVNQTAAGTYAGTISGAGNFALGALSNNTLTLTGDNSYSGTTTINAGTLEVSGVSGDINQSSGITIASGAHFKYNSSVALGTTITNNGGTISGEGDIGVSVALDSLADILAPGNSPGIQEYTVGQTWNSFTYQWEINDWASAVAGTDYDQIQVTGNLFLSGGAGAYAIDVLSLTGLNAPGLVPDFAEGDFSWTILTTSGTLSGFDAANWAVDTSGFSNAFLGDFTLTQAGNNIVLNYAVPEPGAALLGGLGFLLLLRRRR